LEDAHSQKVHNTCTTSAQEYPVIGQMINSQEPWLVL